MNFTLYNLIQNSNHNQKGLTALLQVGVSQGIHILILNFKVP